MLRFLLRRHPWLWLLFCCVGLRAQLIDLGPWAGAVTPYSAVVRALLLEDRMTTLEICPTADFLRDVRTVSQDPQRPGESARHARYTILHLLPDTVYHYRIRAGNRRELNRDGTLRTLPEPGRPASFRFALASDAAAGSEAGAFAEIGYQKPLFLIHLGNKNGPPPTVADAEAFSAGYRATLTSSLQASLYRRLPLVLTWGPGDLGDHATDPAALAAARLAYRRHVPHAPLPADADPTLAPDAPRPLAHSFSVGRTGFIILDPFAGDDNEGPLGAWQRAWLRAELTRLAADHPLLFVVSPRAWTMTTGAQELSVIENWIRGLPATRVIVLSGNGGFMAGRGDDGFPAEFHVGPIDRPRANPAAAHAADWTHGPIAPESAEETFGMVEVTDRGGPITVTCQALNQHGRERLRLEFTIPAP